MSADACCSPSGGDGLILIALILIAGFVYWRSNNWLVGEAKARSGHTILVGRKEVPVRLHALNSLQPAVDDEPPQPWWDASGVKHDGGTIAKGRLAEQIAGKKVKVRLGLQKAPDPYGRVVGQVFVDCEDVGLWMVSNGYAFAANPDAKYDKALWRHYKKVQERAEKKGLGFHSGRFDDPEGWIGTQRKDGRQDFDL